MSRIVPAIIVIIALLGGGVWYWSARPLDMSGTYIARNDRQAFLLQVVQANAGHLIGSLQAAWITPDGKFQSGSVAVSGARDGRTVVLSLTPGGLTRLLFGTLSLSGAISGNSLRVEGGAANSNFDVSFEVGSLTTYKTFVNSLHERSAAILAAKAQAERHRQELAAQAAAQAAEDARQRAAKEATERLNHEAALEAAMIDRTHPAVEARITQLTSGTTKLTTDTDRMADLVRSEQQSGGYLGRNGNRVATSVQQAEFRNESAINSLRQHFNAIQQSGIISFRQKARNTYISCSRLDSPAASTNSSGGANGCSSLAKALPILEADVTKLVAAYDRVFSTWAAERPRQEALVNQAFR